MDSKSNNQHYFKQQFINEIFILLKQENVKNELKQMIKPIIQMILQEIYPYIYTSILFVLISFFLILGIFIIIFKNNNYTI